MEPSLAKGISIITMLIITVIFGYAPYFLVSGKPNSRSVAIREKIIAYLKCFGGGVFMAASLVDMLPEGIRAMNKYFAMIDVHTKFPLFMIFTACGFFTISFVELVAYVIMQKPDGDGESSQHDHHNAPTCDNGSLEQGVSSINGDPGTYKSFRDKESAQGCPGSLVNSDVIEMKEVYQKTEARDTGNKTDPHKEGGHAHNEAEDIINAINSTPLRAFLLLAAISFHSVFDGLAVGLKETTSEVWRMFTAIMIHKSMVAFCLGLQLFMAFKERPSKAFFWNFFFAVIAPMGIGIGMALTTGDFDEYAKQLTNTILTGLACGTFLYVTFFEILKEEMVDNRGMVRLLVVVLGFAAMSLLIYFSTR